MDDFKKAFMEGEREGRSDTREAINSVKESKDIPLSYIKKIVGRSMFVGLVLGVGTFIVKFTHHTNIFLSILLGFVVYIVALLVISLSSLMAVKLAAKRNR